MQTRRRDGNLRAVRRERRGQRRVVPEHRHVRLRRGAQVLQRRRNRHEVAVTRWRLPVTPRSRLRRARPPRRASPRRTPAKISSYDFGRSCRTRRSFITRWSTSSCASDSPGSAPVSRSRAMQTSKKASRRSKEMVALSLDFTAARNARYVHCVAPADRKGRAGRTRTTRPSGPTRAERRSEAKPPPSNGAFEPERPKGRRRRLLRHVRVLRVLLRRRLKKTVGQPVGGERRRSRRFHSTSASHP